jgi:hypothetical protein
MRIRFMSGKALFTEGGVILSFIIIDYLISPERCHMHSDQSRADCDVTINCWSRQDKQSH